MTKEDKERLIAESLKSKEIKDLYEAYIIKEIPFETWVRSMADRLYYVEGDKHGKGVKRAMPQM